MFQIYPEGFKTKVLKSDDSEKLENTIEEWCKKLDIIDIKYSIIVRNDSYVLYSAMVIYIDTIKRLYETMRDEIKRSNSHE